jgi:hypothetical protein
LNTVYSKILNKSAQHFEYQAVDLAILYHFQKGYIVFFSIDLVGGACQP